MERLRIPNLGWILVGDGRKALFLRNDGTADAPQLAIERSFDAPMNPRTSDVGAERPGRVFQSLDGRRSSVEQPDHHSLREVAFARGIAVEIGNLCEASSTKWVALVAAPRTLAVWREHLPDAASPLIRAELAKDLTKHSIAELTRVLAG